MQSRRESPAEMTAGLRETALELSEALAAANYGIRPGYIARDEPRYFEDSIPDEPGVVHQPQIYDFAGYLAERYGCTTIIDIGSGRATKLAPLADRFQIVGIDFGANLEYCRREYDFGQWLEWDLESPEPIPIDETTLESALVVCSDVIEHLRNPGPLWRTSRTGSGGHRRCFSRRPSAIGSVGPTIRGRRPTPTTCASGTWPSSAGCSSAPDCTSTISA